MPKTASKKPIKADKLLDLDKRGLAESMVSGAKKRRGRPKKLQTLEEIKADIDRRNPTYVSPVTGGLLPGTGPKEPKKDKMKEFLTNVLQPSLIKIEENLGKILGNFDKQIELEKERQDDLKVSEELDSEKEREKKLETPKGKGMLKTGFDKAIKPVTGMFDQILKFVTNILLGTAVMGLVKILENPDVILKPLKSFANGLIDFINGPFGLIGGINTFVLAPINFVVQGLLDGLQFILDPIGKLMRIFKLGEPQELPLDSFREKIPPIKIPEIPKFEMEGGGEVPGMGTGDTVPAMLEPGEFVMSKGAVDQIGVGQLELMNAEGGGTNQPIMRGGTSYAKGGGSIGIKGRGNTGIMHMKDADGKPVGRTYSVISGKPGTGNISQEMRNSMPGEGYPMPDGTYKVHSFDEHGPLSGALRGLGDWSAYVGNGDGNIGKRSGMMIHSDIDPYGTLGCIGVDLGGKIGTREEKNFLKAWSMSNPETITVDFGAPSGGTAQIGGGTRSATSDNSLAKMSSSQSGSKVSPPPTPNGATDGLMAMAVGQSKSSGGLTSGNTIASQTGGKNFSSVDVRNNSNIIVQSIYNLVG